jgi:hypothetical protein
MLAAPRQVVIASAAFLFLGIASSATAQGAGAQRERQKGVRCGDKCIPANTVLSHWRESRPARERR